MPEPNAEAIAAKYGGAIAAPDAQAIAKKYGGALAAADTTATPKWSEPGGDVLLDNVRAIAALPGRLLSFAKAHPVETGATLGAAAAVPFTGGGSLAALGPLVPIAAAGLGGAGGAGLGMIAGGMTGADVPS